MWIFYRIKDFIRDIPRNIKWFIQRGIRGYSDQDIWGIDYWFIKTIIPMLKQLKETKHGYPCDMTEEQWEKELNKMIHCFEEIDEDKCSEKNEFEEEFHDAIWINPKNDTEEITKKWINRENEITDYKVRMKNKAFSLFSKYFWNLWD